MDAPDETERGSIEQDANRQRLVEIRCGFAELAQREAETAEARVADANRRTDAQLGILAEVQLLADPSATRAAKENAHRAFRNAVASARDRLSVEAAARAWLSEINWINAGLSKAQLRFRRERETADSLIAERDRLAGTAEAARAMAETARQACIAAQHGILEGTEEELAQAAAALGAAAPSAGAPGSVGAAPAAAAGATATGVASVAGGAGVAGVAGAAGGAPLTIPAAEMAVAQPDGASDQAAQGAQPAPPPGDGRYVDLRVQPPQLIIRLMSRDLWSLNWLVDHLAGQSPSARSAWQMSLSNLVDATIAAAIDDAFFDFAAGSPFWDMFTRDQAREVARGLAALGYRYDGFGAFVDDRVPDQRDLALAIGSAGMYPVRIRYWPKPAEAARLFSDVRVAADLFLATKAPYLTLGELVIALGRRAELLAELWNDWDRARPLLLASPTE